MKATTATAHVAVRDPDPRGLTPVPSFLSQPAKLAEAFKYFVQGMGYSKCAPPGGRWARRGASWECDAPDRVRVRIL